MRRLILAGLPTNGLMPRARARRAGVWEQIHEHPLLAVPSRQSACSHREKPQRRLYIGEGCRNIAPFGLHMGNPGLTLNI